MNVSLPFVCEWDGVISLNFYRSVVKCRTTIQREHTCRSIFANITNGVPFLDANIANMTHVCLLNFIQISEHICDPAWQNPQKRPRNKKNELFVSYERATL